jgi:GT2 family glycosyltransferase
VRALVRPALSVIIPHYQRPELLRACLPSVLKARAATAEPVEIIVADDGSEDDSVSIVRREFPSVLVVERPANGGYPAAVNSGVAASSAPWVLTLNNDTTVAPDLFDQLLRIARGGSGIGSVAAQQRFSSDPGVIYSAGLVLDRRGHNSDRLMGQPASAGESVAVDVFGACGAAALYRREMLDQIGGFDERFRFGLEDADVAWRARMHGWRCVYAPEALVFHDLGGTVPHGTPLRLFQAGRNRVLLLAKNMETRQLVAHLPQILAFDIAYVAYGLVRLHTTAPLRGRLSGLRLWRGVRRESGPRRPIELSPATSFRAVRKRRSAWRLGAGGAAGGSADLASPTAEAAARRSTS